MYETANDQIFPEWKRSSKEFAAWRAEQLEAGKELRPSSKNDHAQNEEYIDPHANKDDAARDVLEGQLDGPEAPAEKPSPSTPEVMRYRITRQDIDRHGPTPHCKRCNAIAA